MDDFNFESFTKSINNAISVLNECIEEKKIEIAKIEEENERLREKIVALDKDIESRKK